LTVAAQEVVDPTFTEVGKQLIESEEIDEEPEVTAMVVVPYLVGSWTEVAVMVTVPPEGAVDGAVKTPEEEMVPALAVHVTAEL
jgi:hypothetical protein